MARFELFAMGEQFSKVLNFHAVIVVMRSEWIQSSSFHFNLCIDMLDKLRVNDGV